MRIGSSWTRGFLAIGHFAVDRGEGPKVDLAADQKRLRQFLRVLLVLVQAAA